MSACASGFWDRVNEAGSVLDLEPAANPVPDPEDRPSDDREGDLGDVVVRCGAATLREDRSPKCEVHVAEKCPEVTATTVASANAAPGRIRRTFGRMKATEGGPRAMHGAVVEEVRGSV